jgi:hypothetical protein
MLQQQPADMLAAPEAPQSSPGVRIVALHGLIVNGELTFPARLIRVGAGRTAFQDLSCHIAAGETAAELEARQLSCWRADLAERDKTALRAAARFAGGCARDVASADQGQVGGHYDGCMCVQLPHALLTHLARTHQAKGMHILQEGQDELRAGCWPLVKDALEALTELCSETVAVPLAPGEDA